VGFRIEDREVLADDLARRVTLQPLRARVPGEDFSAGIEQEQRVVAHAVHHRPDLFGRKERLEEVAHLVSFHRPAWVNHFYVAAPSISAHWIEIASERTWRRAPKRSLLDGANAPFPAGLWVRRACS